MRETGEASSYRAILLDHLTRFVEVATLGVNTRQIVSCLALEPDALPPIPLFTQRRLFCLVVRASPSCSCWRCCITIRRRSCCDRYDNVEALLVELLGEEKVADPLHSSRDVVDRVGENHRVASRVGEGLGEVGMLKRRQ